MKIVKKTCILGLTGMFVLAGGCKKETEQQMSLEVPAVHEISVVQFNTLKIAAEDYGEDKLPELIQNIENAVPIKTEESAGLKREDDYITLSFTCQDESKEIFYFFQKDQRWYMQTEQGEFYTHVDFLTDYISMEEVEPEVKLTFSVPVLKKRLQLEREFEVLNTRFFFISNVIAYQENYACSQEEAITDVMENMKEDRKIYVYAMQNGCNVSDEELEEIVREQTKKIQDASNYEDYEKLYAECKTTLQESMEKNKELIREKAVIDKLYKKKQKEFKDGKDKIGDKICKDANEYYKTFLSEVVIPEMEDYDFSEFLSELDEAKAYYLQVFGEEP